MPPHIAPVVRRNTSIAVLGAVATVLVLAIPVDAAYYNPQAKLATETGIAMVCATASLLVYGRFLRTSALADLLLTYASGVIAASALLLVAVPQTVGADAVTDWAPLVARMTGAALFAAAAGVGTRPVRRRVHPAREAAIGLALLGVGTAVVQACSTWLPSPVLAEPVDAPGSPRLESSTLFLAAQLAHLMLFALAAVGFTRRAAREHDVFLGWVGAATALAAVARLNYFFYPTIYTDWFYLGDLLRLACFALLLVAAVEELRSEWARRTEAAAYGERQRLARDLHDGAIQEIGYLSRQVALVQDLDLRDRMQSAAERALDEARRALSALTAPLDESLEDAIRRATSEVADRYDVPIRFEASQGKCDDPGPDAREALVRVAREAVVNAVRHARPAQVYVMIGCRELLIRDDGCGFDAAAVSKRSGFGMVSMRDRVDGIDGTLEIESAAGSGTRVRVTW